MKIKNYWPIFQTTEPKFTCSKSILETPEIYVKCAQSSLLREQNDVNDVFIVNFEQIQHCSGFPLLTWNK